MTDRPKEDTEPNKQKDDDMANMSDWWRVWHKDCRNRWWKHLLFAVYVAFAFGILIEGEAYTNESCFNSLKQEAGRLLDQLDLRALENDPKQLKKELEETVAKRVRRADARLDDPVLKKAERLTELLAESTNRKTTTQPVSLSDTGKHITILADGPSSFSFTSPRYWWHILVGIVGVAILVLVYKIVTSPDKSEFRPFRGPCILALFILLCFGCDGLARWSVNLSWFPTFTVILTSFYWAALFWFIDRIVLNEGFETALGHAKGDSQKCRSLYDFATFCTKAVATMFLAICIVQGWQLSEAHGHLYENAGVAHAKTTFSVVLIFWGSLGLLGAVGAVSGQRAWKAAKEPAEPSYSGHRATTTEDGQSSSKDLDPPVISP